MDSGLLAIIVACLALAGSIVQSVVTLMRGKKTDATAERAQDTVADDLMLKLLNYANKQVTDWQEAYNKASVENSELREQLNANKNRAIEMRKRLQVAVEYMLRTAKAKGSVPMSEVILWADIALDLDISTEEFHRRMQEHSPIEEDTERSMRR